VRAGCLFFKDQSGPADSLQFQVDPLRPPRKPDIKSNPPAFQPFAILKAAPKTQRFPRSRQRVSPLPSFPFYFLRKTLLTARLRGWPHELIVTLAFLSDQSLTLKGVGGNRASKARRLGLQVVSTRIKKQSYSWPRTRRHHSHSPTLRQQPPSANRACSAFSSAGRTRNTATPPTHSDNCRRGSHRCHRYN